MPEDLPLGERVNFSPVARPERKTLRGRFVLLRPLDADGDAEALFAVSHPPAGNPAIWTYLPYGPYSDVDAMRADLLEKQRSDDPLFFTVIPVEPASPSGVVSYLRTVPEFGVIEIGHIWFGTPMQRTAAATEAIYLLARHVFDDLGYRRLEWKCDALNSASRRAAERFGFTFEGVFRKHLVAKGRNRDSAWYAMLDDEWPSVRAGFERWLDPGNFDDEGIQRTSLSELRLH
jgi:RimJ/RimL family protein N-acetyltransferase